MPKTKSEKRAPLSKSNGRGAPKKREAEKILKNHLRLDQKQWAQEEAQARGISMWSFLRQVIDLGKDVIDTKRGDVSASALFDDTLAEPHKGE